MRETLPCPDISTGREQQYMSEPEWTKVTTVPTLGKQERTYGERTEIETEQLTSGT